MTLVLRGHVSGQSVQHPVLLWVLTSVVLVSGSGTARANQAPLVDHFAALPTVVLPGETATLTVEAHDPDCPDSCTTGCGLYIRQDLTQWSASGGSFVGEDNGASSSPYTATAEWQAPAAEGDYTVGVSLSDSGTLLCGGRQTTVVELVVQVSTSTNQPPSVDSLTAAPPAVFVDESSALECLASDPEGEPLSYSWSTDLGTVIPTTEGNAKFSSTDPGVATVVCTATDPGGAIGSGFTLVSVHGALPEARLLGGLVAPQRVAADSTGNLYVVDSGRGLSVVHLDEGELVYRLSLPGVTAVAVDWNDRLLVGGTFGLHVISRAGELFQALAPGSAGLDVADVAVDPVERLYAVLYRRSGSVRVYDEQGQEVLTLGSTGDGPEQFKSPQGLSAAAEEVLSSGGRWVVADAGHGELKVFDATGTLVDTLGGLGGGVGEFVQLDDVEVSDAGIIYASDSFQDWVQSFNPDGTPREILGTYGGGIGEFKTAAGLTVADDFDRLIVASTNSSSLQAFRTTPNPTMPPPPPVGVVTPEGIDFGPQSIGSTSPWQTVVLSNQGSRALGLLQSATTGDFSHDQDCPVFLEPGEECTVQVTFAPQFPGLREGRLTIEASWGDPLIVKLVGKGFVPPAALLAPSSIFFPDQLVGTVSEEESVILTNPGTVGLAISAIGASGDFGYLSACPSVLPGGADCEILVNFLPTTVSDEILGTLSIVSNAAGSPHEVALGGASYGSDTLISVADVEVDEAAAEAAFPVQLSLAAQGPVTVAYRTVPNTAVEGEDFLPVEGILVFPAGETEADVAVTIVDDAMLEPDTESFWLELFDPIGGQLGDDVGEAVIHDDDLCLGPNLLVNPSAEEWTGLSRTPGWLSPSPSMAWSLSRGPPEPVDGLVFFFAGDSPLAEIYQDVPVAAYADEIDAGAARFAFEGWVRSAEETPADLVRLIVEYRDADNTTILDTFDSGWVASVDDWLRLADSRAATPGSRWLRVRLLGERQTGAKTDAMVDALALRSERLPTVSLADAALPEGDAGSSTMTFTAQLSCPYWQSIEMEFLTSDDTATAGEDYLEAAGLLVVGPGEPAGEIGVEILGDEVVESDEDFLLDLSDESIDEVVLLRAQAVGTILDDDGAMHPVGWWEQRPDAWPSVLEVAGESWGRDRIAEALGTLGGDPVVRLVRQLVAARLNLAAGGPRGVQPTVLRAESLISGLAAMDGDWRELDREAAAVADELEVYNTGRIDSEAHR